MPDVQDERKGFESMTIINRIFIASLVGGAISTFVVAPVAFSAGAESAVDFVKGLYPPKVKEPGRGARYSQRIKKLQAACQAYAKKTGDLCMDSNLFVMAQDWDIKKIDAKKISGSDSIAVVTVSFTSMREKTTLTYDLKKEDGAWTIDDIRQADTKCSTLSTMLRHESLGC
jgi:hypothetical protein